jgi:hypothetical protein
MHNNPRAVSPDNQNNLSGKEDEVKPEIEIENVK